MPLANAWPAEPRIVNAVMFVPKSDSRNTTGPSDAAGQEVVLGFVIRRPAVAEREDADVEDDREVGEDEDRRNQRRRLLLERTFVVEMMRPGHAASASTSAAPTATQ